MGKSGSYIFEQFNQQELDRLMHQGRATWADELKFLQWAGLRAGDRVLDVGCGPGVISSLIAEYVGPKGAVTGVDISEELLATGRALSRNQVTFTQGSVYDLGAFRGQFDFVYARLVFQHLSKPAEAMAQIHSALYPNGRVCVLDSDEGLFGIYPEPPGLAKLLGDTQQLQQQRGGDRFIGGKLAYIMKTAGFLDVTPRVFLMTPDSIGRKQFLDTILSWRALLYSEGARKAAAKNVQMIYQQADKCMLSGHNGSFVVRGRSSSISNQIEK